MKTFQTISLVNSLSRKKEIFQPLQAGKITFYSCGPTVYGMIHIGNLRSAIVADLFYRYFKKIGYEVTYVRNYTDIDDKIIHQSKKEGTTAKKIAEKYIQEVEKDYALADIQEPTHKTKVTDTIPEIIELIQTLLQKKHAYLVEGEVLFSVESFKNYGKLSNKDLEKQDVRLALQSRIEDHSKKRSPLDFTLWKPAKPEEPFWESPWGPGRPGWHIECSAMAIKWLGKQIDIHHGGEDLIFPHHENEIAQTEAATHVHPFAHYWLHHAFVTLSKEKMSKSLGNIFTAREFLSQYSGEVARYMLLSVHYRSTLDFSEETLEHSLSGLRRIYEAKTKAFQIIERGNIEENIFELKSQFLLRCETIKTQIYENLSEDFNTPLALGSLFTLIREWNQLINSTNAPSYAEAKAFLSILDDDIGEIFGFGHHRAMPHFLTEFEAKEIEAMINERKAAKKEKNFQKSDLIREELMQKGIQIQDHPDGITTWEKVRLLT